jgi:hypothetical protein
MARNSFWTVVLAMVALVSVNAAAQKNEIAGSVGRFFISDQGVLGANPSNPNIHFGNSLSYEANYAHHLLDLGIIGVALEVPFVFTPSVKMHFIEGITPKNYRSYFVTPAARVSLFPSTSFSPWVSFGGGVGRFSTSSQLEFGGDNPGHASNTTGAFQIGGGLDVKIFPAIKLRGEVRDFNSGVPALNVNTGKTRQHNIFAGAGVVFSF